MTEAASNPDLADGGARLADKSPDHANETQSSTQILTLIKAALAIAATLDADKPATVTVHENEAKRLLEVPVDLARDISALAQKRVRMRGHEHLEMSDITWAWNRLVVGKKSSTWLLVLNTVGGIILGIGVPVLLTPIVNNTAPTVSGLVLGGLLSLAGISFVSVALTISFFRK